MNNYKCWNCANELTNDYFIEFIRNRIGNKYVGNDKNYSCKNCKIPPGLLNNNGAYEWSKHYIYTNKANKFGYQDIDFISSNGEWVSAGIFSTGVDIFIGESHYILKYINTIEDVLKYCKLQVFL